MKKETVSLREFLSQKLESVGLEMEEAVLQALSAAVVLEEGDPKEEEETRTVRLTEDTDGEITADRLHWYNLMRVSFHDLTGFLIKESAIILTEDTRLKVFLSLLNLLHEFYPKLTMPFNQADAKVLSAIYFLEKKTFSLPDLEASYARQFSEPLPQERSSRALNSFAALKIIKPLGEGQYQVRERMTYERK